MTPEEYQRFLENIDPLAKKRLLDIDIQIKESQDKPPEYFIEKFKEGDPAFDSEMYQLNKYQFAAFLLNDPENCHRVLLTIWNALCKKHHDFMEMLVMLQDAKKKN